MKDLTNILQKGDMSPKQRFLLLVHNSVSKDKTGKEILTKADKYVTGEKWIPKDNDEVREWNRYSNGWEIEGGAKLDAQTIYLNAQLALTEASRIVDYMLWTNNNKFGIVDYEKDGVLELILRNSGLEYDSTIHRLSFSRLNEDLKADVLALCSDADIESQYLDQEEELAMLFNNEDQLSRDSKKELADLMLKYISGKYAELIEDNRWWFFGYYAELPVSKIAERWALYNDVEHGTTDELVTKMVNFAQKNKVSLRELLKDTIMRWLNEGLFVNEYIPLCKSNGIDTCNNIKTKNPHKKVLEDWIKIKNETKVYIKRMITDGLLELEIRNKKILNHTFDVKIITGESLYSSKEDTCFIKDYKEQVNNFIPLGWLIIFLQERSFLGEYSNLLTFEDIYKKLSKIYEIDLTYIVTRMVDNFRKSLDRLRLEIKHIADKLTDDNFLENKNTFPIDISVDDMLVGIDRIEPKIGETETFYINEFKDIFGSEFDT